MDPMTVAIHGLGTIGRAVASTLLSGEDGLRLGAISTRHPDEARAWLAQRCAADDVLVGDADDAGRSADVVIESSGLSGFESIARAASRWHRIFIPATVGGLLEHESLLAGVARVVVPSGAIGGLDLIRAAQADRSITRLHIETRKPPTALPAGATSTTDQPVRLFSGTVREGYSQFPANVNVAVACALCGPGPDHTMLEVWTDPTVLRNTHRVSLESADVRAQFTIENIPSSNPKTGLVTSASIVSALRQLVGPRQFL